MPSRAQRLDCNARLVALYLDSDSRVLDLGMSRRIYDRHQRLVLAARDEGCVWAGCDRLVCHFHHFLLSEGEWTARMAADGVVEIIPPTRVDPDQVPRWHARFTRQPRAA
ncbi:MAG: endonuclease [Aeromicrobium sp.]|nr:endonuclease [Aeromicrobium sp.]